MTMPTIVWDMKNDPHGNNIKVRNLPCLSKRHFITDVSKKSLSRIADTLASNSANWMAVVNDMPHLKDLAIESVTANITAAYELGIIDQYAKIFALATQWPYDEIFKFETDTNNVGGDNTTQHSENANHACNSSS